MSSDKAPVHKRLQSQNEKGLIKETVTILYLAGMKASEIARETGYSLTYCSTIIRQVTKEMKQQGINDIHLLIVSKFQQLIAHHTIVTRAQTLEFTHLNQRIAELSGTDRTDQDNTVRDKLVDRQLEIGKTLMQTNKVFTDCLKLLGASASMGDAGGTYANNIESHTQGSKNNKIPSKRISKSYEEVRTVDDAVVELEESVGRVKAYRDELKRKKGS